MYYYVSIICTTLQPAEELPLVARVKYLKSKVDALRTVSLFHKRIV